VCFVACFWLSEVLLFICGREVPYNKGLLARYHKALDRAVQLATVHNIQPIPGTTVILCDVRPAMQQPCTSAKGLGKPRTVSSALLLHICTHACTHTHIHFAALWTLSRITPGEPVPEPIWILLKQETVSGSGISCAICKSAPRLRQTTTPGPHHSVFTGRIPFLLPNQQRQIYLEIVTSLLICILKSGCTDSTLITAAA